MTESDGQLMDIAESSNIMSCDVSRWPPAAQHKEELKAHMDGITSIQQPYRGFSEFRRYPDNAKSLAISEGSQVLLQDGFVYQQGPIEEWLKKVRCRRALT